MARARNIKPGFFQNEVLGDLEPIERLAFIGLWTLCDFKGCMEYRPKRLKNQVLPYDNCDIEKIMINLDRSGFISIYSVLGQMYIKVVNFIKHQNPHKNERDGGSDIPDLPENFNKINEMSEDGTKPDKIGPARADSFLLIPDSLNLIPESVTPQRAPSAAPPVADYSPEFLEAWDSYPSRPGASKKEALKAWNARLKAGVGSEILLAGVRRYANYVRAMKTEPQYVKQPQTFFGPGEHYLADWSSIAPVARAGPQESEYARKRREFVEATTGRNRHGRTNDEQRQSEGWLQLAAESNS